MLPVRRLWLEFIVCLILSLIVLLTFHPSLRWDLLIWDDDINIYGNPNIQTLDWPHLRWMFTDYSYLPRYVPLSWLGWAIIYHFFGLNPSGYHYGTVLLHVVNTTLVFWLIRQLLTYASGPQGRVESMAVTLSAGFAALLWGVHPLRAESVAWASGQTHIQALFFLLLSALCYLRSTEARARPSPNAIFYWLAVVSFAASLLTYPVGLGFVFVLMVLDVYPLHRFHRGSTFWRDTWAHRIWLEKIPFLMVAGAILFITSWARIHATGFYDRPVPLQEFGLFSRMMRAFYLWAYYVWKPWLPVNLSPVYTTLVEFDPTGAPFLFSMALVVGITVLAIALRHRCPALLAVWICHLSLLAPMLGLTERPYYPNDRYSYIEGVCWSALIGGTFLMLWQKSTKRSIVTGVCLLIAFIVGISGRLTHQQTMIWKDNITLFQYIISKLGDHPYRSDIEWRLGYVYMQRGNTEQALQYLNSTLNSSPNHFKSRLYRGGILFNEGKLEEAAQDFRQALEVREDPQVHYYLGLTLARMGRRDEAIEHFSRALQLNPEDKNSALMLAKLLRQSGPNQRSTSPKQDITGQRTVR